MSAPSPRNGAYEPVTRKVSSVVVSESYVGETPQLENVRYVEVSQALSAQIE